MKPNLIFNLSPENKSAGFQREISPYIGSRPYICMNNTLTTQILRTVGFKIKFLGELLFRTAMTDGILSDDELNILYSVDYNLTKLQDTVNHAYEDDIIEDYEIEQIENILSKIVNDAIYIAKYDDCITQDDGRLLQQLQRFLKSFEKLILGNKIRMSQN